MTQRSRLHGAAVWLGLLSAQPKPRPPAEVMLLCAVMIVFWFAVLVALTR